MICSFRNLTLFRNYICDENWTDSENFTVTINEQRERVQILDSTIFHVNEPKFVFNLFT